MKQHYRTSENSLRKVAIGLVLVAAGVLLMLNKLGFLNGGITHWLFSWPMLLVAIGFVNLFGRDNYFSGLILIVVGGFFLIPRILGFDYSFVWTFWPTLLIIGGVLVIFKHSIFQPRRSRDENGNVNDRRFFSSNGAEADADGFIESYNIFGGSNRRVVKLTGGKIVNLFGGSEIDLTQAAVEGDVVYVEMINIFGGGTLFVPSDWDVQIEVVSIFGGFSDKRRFINTTLVEGRKKLIVKGICVLGGGEVNGKY